MLAQIRKTINHARTLYEAGEYYSAIDILHKVLDKYPQNIQALEAKLACVIATQNWPASHALALAVNKFNPSTNNIVALGSIQVALGDFNQAITTLNRVPPHNLNNVALINLGIAYRSLQRYDQAFDCFDKAINLNNQDSFAYLHRGIAHYDMNNIDNSINDFKQAIDLKYDNFDAHFCLGLSYLKNGDYHDGWKQYESRFYQSQPVVRLQKRVKPRWDGKTFFSGMRILLDIEQGIGDVIQFTRFIKPLAEKGVKVIVQSNNDVADLLRQVEGVDHLHFYDQEEYTEYDYCYHICSLPYALGSTLDNLPEPTQGIKAVPEYLVKWNKILGDKQKLRVGLVWNGNPGYTYDFRRSIDLFNFVDYLPDGIEYISLAKTLEPKDQAICTGQGIKFFSDKIISWLDTQALIELCDIVISVDTSVPILSATMMKPTWLLLPYATDWRWLIQREDSPWFSHMSLIRQKNPDEGWHDCLLNVKSRLNINRDLIT